MKRLLTSCFGLGRLPLAPGSWGSLPPVVVFALMGQLHIPAVLISIIMAALALAGAVVCVKFAPVIIASTGKTDPGEVVTDEVAGQAITLLAAPFLFTPAVSTRQIWFVALLGLFLFRLFDAIKPWPIRRMEKLPAGWGILCDDLLAGAYSGVIFLVCLKLWVFDYVG